MATWADVCELAGRHGGSQLGASAWLFELPGAGGARRQKVFVFHERMQPDLEFVQVKSPFVRFDDVDPSHAMRSLGQLLAGSIGYAPLFDRDGNAMNGFLNLSTSMPLAALDLSDPAPFFRYLDVVAQAADDIERALAGPSAPDLY